MRSFGFWALVVEIVLFLVIAAVCCQELLMTSAYFTAMVRFLRQPRDRYRELLVVDEAETGDGGGARRAVQVMLTIACIARACLTTFILARVDWAPYLTLHDLVYLATYGLLVVFLAQMRHIAAGYRFVWVKTAALATLAGVLVVSLAVCTLRWGTADPRVRSSLRKFLYYELGLTYLAFFLSFVYFGSRVCAEALSNKRLFYRILLLTIVCGVALSSKGYFFVAAAVNAWRTDAIFQTPTERYRFEALIALEELIPSIAILLLTARGRGRRNPPRSSAEVTPLGHFHQRFSSSSSSNWFIPSDSPGPVAVNAFTYGSGLNHA